MKVLHQNINYSTRKLHQILVSTLSDLGVNNIVFAPTYDTSKTIIESKDNEIISSCFNKNDRYIFDLKQKKIYNALKNNVDLSSIDIVHAHTLFTDGNIALRIKKDYGIPYVVAVRNQDVNMFFKKMLFLRKRGLKILLNSDAVFFLSGAYKEKVINKYIPVRYHKNIDQKSFLIPNGIDKFWFDNKLESKKVLSNERKIKLLYVGEICKNKNIETIQKSMKLLTEKGIESNLTIVGPVVDEKYYSKIIKDKRTHHINQIPKEKLICEYRKSDIFVMPSIYETFGLVYAEAMSQGLPVIYSRDQGFDKQFVDGVVGFSVGSLNYVELSEKIIKTINKYESISENCLNLFSRFDWEKISDKYIDIYNNILSGDN